MESTGAQCKHFLHHRCMLNKKSTDQYMDLGLLRSSNMYHPKNLEMSWVRLVNFHRHRTRKDTRKMLVVLEQNQARRRRCSLLGMDWIHMDRRSRPERQILDRSHRSNLRHTVGRNQGTHNHAFQILRPIRMCNFLGRVGHMEGNHIDMVLGHSSHSLGHKFLVGILVLALALA